MKDSLIKEIGVAETGERTFATIRNPKPEPIVCNFCGKKLEYTVEGEGIFAYYQPPARCECKGAKNYWTIYDERMKEIEEKCDQIVAKERRRREVEKLLKRSHLGVRFSKRTFDTFMVKDSNKDSYKKALDYAENFEKYEKEGLGLLLTGPVGTGKTHLAAAIANYLINEKVIPVKFGNITMLLSEIKSTYNGVTETTEEEVINTLSNVRLLIIDDLGKEKTSDWTQQILYTVINNRYENYKPLVVTTNYNLQDLEDKIGPATLSRIIEMCKGIKMDGVDYRKVKLMG